MIGPGPGAVMPHVASVAYRNWPVNCFSRELSMGCIGFPLVNYLPVAPRARARVPTRQSLYA
jgi:hypothetical protein